MIETMSIGAAVALLKRGRKVAREGWNGKGMYLFLAQGSVEMSAARFSVTCTSPEPLPIAPVVCMRTAQATIVPGWLASQADLLAEDWLEVE